MIVCVPSAVLYRYPDAKSEMTDELLFGTVCEVLDTVDDYCRIETDYGYRGYLRRSDLCAGEQQPSRVVCVPCADLLYTPEYRRAPRMTLPMGSVVDAACSKIEPRYAFVYLPDKTVCCIRKEALAPLPVPMGERETREAVVRTAQSYLGTQYRWGGKTACGIDCSGLAFMSYFRNGILIWRDAAIKEGYPIHEIPIEQAKPGDLLFFPGHVAIYLGNGKIIHATGHPESSCVTFNSLREGEPGYREDLKNSMCAAGSIF